MTLQDASRIENLNGAGGGAREFDALRGQAGGPLHPDPGAAGPAPGSLADFLEQVSLVADADQVPAGEDHDGLVTLMTLHTAKGLEFPVVFLTGMEENVFPHQRAVNDPQELQEERRLAYVGITRAEQRLYLTQAVDAPGNRRVRGVRGLRRLVSPSPRRGRRHPHDDFVLTAPGDHPAATNALRAMFTRDFVYLGALRPAGGPRRGDDAHPDPACRRRRVRAVVAGHRGGATPRGDL